MREEKIWGEKGSIVLGKKKVFRLGLMKESSDEGVQRGFLLESLGYGAYSYTVSVNVIDLCVSILSAFFLN